MCRILGAKNNRFDESILSLINHSSPGSSGTKNFNAGTNKVILEMTRLAIVDLSEAGEQPMVFSCGNYEIVFNSEIYNHLQLKEKSQEI